MFECSSWRCECARIWISYTYSYLFFHRGNWIAHCTRLHPIEFEIHGLMGAFISFAIWKIFTLMIMVGRWNELPLSGNDKALARRSAQFACNWIDAIEWSFRACKYRFNILLILKHKILCRISSEAIICLFRLVNRWMRVRWLNFNSAITQSHALRFVRLKNIKIYKYGSRFNVTESLAARDMQQINSIEFQMTGIGTERQLREKRKNERKSEAVKVSGQW